MEELLNYMRSPSTKSCSLYFTLLILIQTLMEPDPSFLQLALSGVNFVSAPVALISTGLFAGAALYITAVEHPIRLASNSSDLDLKSGFIQWAYSYPRYMSLEKGN